MLIKDMQPEDKLKAILELMNQGKTTKEIAEIGGYSRVKSIGDFLRDKGYIYNKNTKRYELKEEPEAVAVCQVADSNQSLPLDNQKFKDDLIELVHNFDEIKEVLAWYRERDKIEIVEVIQEGLQIDLPAYEGKAYRASIRINPIVWNEFDKFATKYPQFVKADLIAQAMKEYMDKHN